MTGPRILYLRHREAPDALGCRWCGYGERGHGSRWVASRRSYHFWTEPTREQVEARMRARLAKRRQPRVQ